MKFLLTIALLFFTIELGAEVPGGDIFNYPLKPEDMGAFTTTCLRLAEHSFVTGKFEQERKISRTGRSLKSAGNFVIAKDMGMVWDTVTPVAATITLGKDYIIQARPGRRRTLISAQGNETFLRTAEVLSMVFTGNAQGLLDNFEVFYFTNTAGWELGLYPKNSAIHSFAERIIIKGDTVIKYIQLYEQSGDTIIYSLSNHSHPAELGAHEKAFFTLP